MVIYALFGLCLTSKKFNRISSLEVEPTIYSTRGKHANHYITDADNDVSSVLD
jgi:hypothetical protein